MKINYWPIKNSQCKQSDPVTRCYVPGLFSNRHQMIFDHHEQINQSGQPIPGVFFTKRRDFRLVQIESVSRLEKLIRLLTTLKEKASENIGRKGENAGKQHFLFFPQCFLPFPKQILIFHLISFCVCVCVCVVSKCFQFGPV